MNNKHFYLMSFVTLAFSMQSSCMAHQKPLICLGESTPGCCRKPKTYFEVYNYPQESCYILVSIKEAMLTAGKQPLEKLLQVLSPYKENYWLALAINISPNSHLTLYKASIQRIVNGFRKEGWFTQNHRLEKDSRPNSNTILRIEPRYSRCKPLYTIERNETSPKQINVHLSEGFLMSPIWYKCFATWRSNDFIKQFFRDLNQKKQEWGARTIRISCDMPDNDVLGDQAKYYRNTIEPYAIIQLIERICKSRRWFGSEEDKVRITYRTIRNTPRLY